MTEDEMYQAVLKYGFFPDRVEGMFSAVSFGNWVLDHESTIKSLDKSKVFKTTTYKATRNNNSPRYFGIIHPEAFARLAFYLKANWSKLEQFVLYPYEEYQEVSMIRAKARREARLFSLSNYDKPKDELAIRLKIQMGNKFVVKADISNCFPSIYTHSVPWALIGKDESKKPENQDPKQWFNQLDSFARLAQDKETLGLPIGSDVSNLIAEIILSQIDKNLIGDFKFVRFIDDYTCYCEDAAKAEDFIASLAKELEKYKLKLNTKKTKITSLPDIHSDEWVRNLRRISGWKSVSANNRNQAIDFLDEASELFKENPNESPIRYALKVLSKKRFDDFESFELVFSYILNLCFLFPYVIDMLGRFIELGLSEFPQQKEKTMMLLQRSINHVVNEHIRFARTDAIAWALAYAVKYDLNIEGTNNIKEVALSQEDYCVLLVLYVFQKNRGEDTGFVDLDKIKDTPEAWLLEYEYRLHEDIAYENNQFMEQLRKAKISFLDASLRQKS